MSWMVLALALVMVPLSGAQDDLAKALVGKWEGTVTFRFGKADPNRTLIIDSIRQSGEKWVANGRFWIPGQGFGRVQIDVDASGSQPVIRFVTGTNVAIRLQLLQGTHLVGTFTPPGTAEGGNDSPMKLQKVQ